MSRTYISGRITIAASASGLISALAGNWKSAVAERNDSWVIKSIGSGTLTIKPIIDGLTTHATFTVTNDTIILDMDDVGDWNLEETSTSNGIEVFVSGFRTV